jgi:recombination protein RecT
MNQLTKSVSSLTTFLTSDAVKSKINSIVGDKKDGARLISTIVSAVQQNPSLAQCEQGSIVNCGLLAHTLKLEPSPQLGYFYLVPFKKNTKNPDGTWSQSSVSTPVIGYKGLIQLALRTGQYKSINAIEIKRGELVKFDRLTDEIEINFEEDDTKRDLLPTIGYASIIELTNGFRKVLYWSKEKVEQHAIKYSSAYAYDLKSKKQESFWSKNFDEQAKKTMLRQIISKYGIVSTEIQEALQKDSALIKDDGNVEYVDNKLNETGEIEDTLNETVAIISQEQQDQLLEAILTRGLIVADYLKTKNVENINYVTVNEYEAMINELK